MKQTPQEFRTTHRPSGRIYNSVDEMMDTILGPAQHDAHLKPWRWQRYCQETYGFTPTKASAR